MKYCLKITYGSVTCTMPLVPSNKLDTNPNFFTQQHTSLYEYHQWHTPVSTSNTQGHDRTSISHLYNFTHSSLSHSHSSFLKITLISPKPFLQELGFFHFEQQWREFEKILNPKMMNKVQKSSHCVSLSSYISNFSIIIDFFLC